MPVVGVNRDKLFAALGKEFTEDEFQELCFDYGIELDDVTSEKEMLRKELGLADGDVPAASEEIIYKIDIPANRYDMLCLEGISRALNIFRRTVPNVTYSLADMSGKEMEKMVVKQETSLVRPFVVCAVLRGVTFDATRYASFIDLQDKLHQNLCRHRSLVAIGTHDLSKLQGPFTYEALPPEEINFVPLKQEKSFAAGDLLEHYLENDKKLGKYVPLIKDSVVYPVIYDANRTVLSLPPIINGAHSAISLDTKDIFIECTATDLTKAEVVLNTVVCMFSEYCTKQFEVEPVEVVDAFKTKKIYPDLASRGMEVPVDYINNSVGVSLEPEEISTFLTKMMFKTDLVESDTKVRVEIPPTRSDVLHACDVMEDVAIAYGYNNIQKTLPSCATQGRELPLNHMSELIRTECAMAGFTEILTWCLCSKAENFHHLRRDDELAKAVCIGNPATVEFEVCRTSLLPGALKTLGMNGDAPKPLKLFEISDVVMVSDETSVGAKNERRLVAVFCSKESGFEVIHGLLNRVMDVLGVPLKGENPSLEKKLGGSYEWKPINSATFFPGRQAGVYFKEKQVGNFGVIHPEVLGKFDIDYPVSALEISLEPFCFDQFYSSLLVAL
ncbi:hypothetical protein BSKO_02143 [Bryopsis sp. KO-2023]|nr:hypothetical protein BSKO_02143 [Bryopsis sp. KO-2023]